MVAESGGAMSSRSRPAASTPISAWMTPPRIITAAPTTYEGESTTHLTTADRWGNVVAYTLTIEQTGGSGITVPGRGFLLNNELTDFSFAPANPAVHDPNLPGPGKRPRSSMAPTIVLGYAVKAAERDDRERGI